MSGPVTVVDVAVTEQVPAAADGSGVVVTESRPTEVGRVRVRRALPHRARRTVGAWCFVDHFGPADVTEDRGIDIGPHPHMGLQTVTWLFTGEVLHRDSLGSEQVVRPGQLNLMTAGRGVAHAEEATGSFRGELQGLQLWVAQPAATREGAAAFEHHPELPRLALAGCEATVLVGELAGALSPARRDNDHLGADLAFHGGATAVPADRAFEYALVVASGTVTVEGEAVPAGRLAYLGSGRDELAFTVAGEARALLLGGTPFAEQLLMWWNFVARTREEVDAAHAEWMADGGRFGQVASALPRVIVGRPPWSRAR